MHNMLQPTHAFDGPWGAHWDVKKNPIIRSQVLGIMCPNVPNAMNMTSTFFLNQYEVLLTVAASSQKFTEGLSFKLECGCRSQQPSLWRTHQADTAHTQIMGWNMLELLTPLKTADRYVFPSFTSWRNPDVWGASPDRGLMIQSFATHQSLQSLQSASKMRNDRNESCFGVSSAVSCLGASKLRGSLAWIRVQIIGTATRLAGESRYQRHMVFDRNRMESSRMTRYDDVENVEVKSLGYWYLYPYCRDAARVPLHSILHPRRAPFWEHWAWRLCGTQTRWGTRVSKIKAKRYSKWK